MKPTLLCLLLLLLTQIVLAQYISIPTSNAKWSIAEDVYDDPNSYPYVDRRAGFLQEVSGDTIIDGMVYQKIYQRPTWWRKTLYLDLPNGETYTTNESGNYSSSNATLIGVMRQDIAARKVYYRSFVTVSCMEPIAPSSPDEEILLLDFDLAVGDTVYLGLNLQRSHIIESVDSVEYNDGIYRKRYFPMNSYPQFHFIEGIGTSTGLFSGIREDFVEGEWCNLNCFSANGQYAIGNSIYNCDSINVLTPVLEINRDTKISIYPNPFDQYLQIEAISTKTNTFRLLIHNSLGQLITEKMISSNGQYQINTQNFAAGIFLVSIYKGTQLIRTETIIK